MRRSVSIAVASVLSILALACREETVTPPVSIPPPSTEIVDAAHGATGSGFYFLPPLVPDPGGEAAGEFDATLAPVVEICALGGEGCVADQPDAFPIRYTMETGPGSETIRVDEDAEQYVVNWHAGDFALDPAVTYRIRVLVAGTELGHADVDVVSSGGQLKNVNTEEYVPLKDGRTLPIKFRINQGAVYVVGTGGGTVTAQDGIVTLTLPERDEPIGITVWPATDYPSPPNLVSGTVFELGPEGTSFDPPATLSIRYDPQDLPPNTYPRMHRLVDGVWEPVSGSTADLNAQVVTAPVSGFSVWAVLGTGTILTVHVTGGQGQVSVQEDPTLAPCTYNDVTCSKDFTPGTSLTLLAETLGPDASFEDWSSSAAGFACTTDPSCPITMDQDMEVTARFSMPGLISVDPKTATFSMVQGGSASPAAVAVTVTNYGGRDVNLADINPIYAQEVTPWLGATITSTTVTTASPETLTLSVSANTLPPGVYDADVHLTDGFAFDRVEVTLTVTPASTFYTFDGAANEFGPLPIIPAVFTSADGSDVYPVGSTESFLFSLFDTGSDIVFIGPSDAATLGFGTGSPTNLLQNTRVRVSGLSAISTGTLLPPFGPHGASDGAQAEVTNVRVGLRPSPDVTLIGAPVANEVLARIDNTTTVTRGPYAFCGGCNASGPDITFYMPQDAGIPTPTLEVPLERFGSTGTSGSDNATKGQKYFIRNVLFGNGANAVMDDPTATVPIRFWIDTGAPPTLINTRMAGLLGIDLTVGGTFDCWSGEAGNEGYVIDRIDFVGTGAAGVGTYEVTNAPVCVDVNGTQIRQHYQDANGITRGMDATIGANLFMYLPILFNGAGDKLGIGTP